MCIFCIDGKCCSSCSSNHLKMVSRAICKRCDSYQDKPTISDKVQIQELIKKALSYIETPYGTFSYGYSKNEGVILSANNFQTAINMLKTALKV